MCVKCFETTKKTNKRNAMKCINKIFLDLLEMKNYLYLCKK